MSVGVEDLMPEWVREFHGSRLRSLEELFGSASR